MPFWQKLKKSSRNSKSNLLENNNSTNNNNNNNKPILSSSNIFTNCSKLQNDNDNDNQNDMAESSSQLSPESIRYKINQQLTISSTSTINPDSDRYSPSNNSTNSSSTKSNKNNNNNNKVQLAELTPILTQNSPLPSPKASNSSNSPSSPPCFSTSSIINVSKHAFDDIKPGEKLKIIKKTSDFIHVQKINDSTISVIPRNSLLQIKPSKNKLNPTTYPLDNKNRNLDGSLNFKNSTKNIHAISEKLISKACDLWFHSNIDRQECEIRLSDYCDGAFLVRESKRFDGDFVLCVNFQERIQYYRISRKNDKFSLDDEDFFNDLESLILHYQSDADGLCCKLTLPVVVQELLPKIKVEVIDNLGSGEFSEVKSIKIENSIYAAKCCSMDDKWHKSNLLREANTHLMLNSHENIVKCVGICNILESDNIMRLTITLENMPRGDLQSILRNNRKSLSSKNLHEFSIDICSALDFMVSKHRIIHRDIASRNVLITEDNIAKLADFGMAVPLSAITSDYALNANQLSPEKSKLTKSPTVDSNKLPIRWIAPEAYNSHRFSEASDVWSFGVLLWEIFTFGRVPYGRISTSELIKKIEEEGLRCENFEGMIPVEMYNFMVKNCWSLVASERFSFSRLLEEIETLYLVDFVEGCGYDVVECNTSIQI